MRITLIRHGQSVANQEGRMQGQMDFPLSSQGTVEVKALGEWLKDEHIDALYSSDLTRAVQTAEQIAFYRQVDIQPHEGLREFHLGEFQGLTRQEAEDKYPQYAGLDWWTAGVAGVEQIKDFEARALGVMEELLLKHRGEHVYVVTHGGFISSLLMALLGIEWKGRRVFAIHNTSMTTIDWSNPKQCMVMGVNETPHLDALKRRQHMNVAKEA